MSMSIPYERSGRTRQKSRTRHALVEATRRLLAGGRAPTVEEAAGEAGISRATAYRYFPNQRALLVAAYPELVSDSLLPGDAPTGLEERLDLAVGELVARVLEHEAELRTMLRLALEEAPADQGRMALRQGRAVRWLEEALAGVLPEIGPSAFRRLVLAIRSATGIEALVWLTDVAGLTRDEAGDLMRWSARALLAATRSEVR
jgi:AcrR family transcriptional regulator